MNMTALLPGRPVNAADREPVERACYDFLDGLGVAYERVDHDAAFTLEACKEVDGALGATICKNLFLCNRQQTEFYLLCMPGDKPFKTKYLSAQIGSARLSFAPEDKLWELLRCTPGSATILGLMNDTEHRVHLLIDRPVYEAEYLSCHPCICTSSLKLKTSDVLTKLLPHTGHTPRIVDLPDTIE